MAGFLLLKSFLQSSVDSLEIVGQALKIGVSKPYGKFKLLIVAGFVLGLLLFAVNANNIFISFISEGRSNNEVFSGIYSVASGNPSGLITIAIWSFILSAMFVPVVSNSILSIYNKSSMISVKKNDMHIVTDSMLLQFVSMITLMQLLMVLGVGSILKFTTNVSDMVFVNLGMVWFFFSILTCFMAWFMELLLRRYGSKVKALYIAVQALIFMSVYSLTPNLSASFFGLDVVILDASNSIMYSILFIVVSLVFILAISLSTFKLGLYVLNFTTAYTIITKKASNRMVNINRLVGRVLWRNGNIKVPIAMIVIVPAGAAMFSSGSPAALVGFIVAIPMVLSMAAAVNIFGIIGSGNAWAFSLPQFTVKSLKFFFLYNFAAIMVANFLVLLPSFLTGNVSLLLYVGFLLSTVISGSIMSMLALYYAYKTPNRYDAHIRGENILPPSKSLKVLGMMVVCGGLPAGLIFNSANLIVEAAVGVVVFLVCYRMVKKFNVKLSEGLNVNEVVSLTS